MKSNIIELSKSRLLYEYFRKASNTNPLLLFKDIKKSNSENEFWFEELVLNPIKGTKCFKCDKMVFLNGILIERVNKKLSRHEIAILVMKEKYRFDLRKNRLF